LANGGIPTTTPTTMAGMAQHGFDLTTLTPEQQQQLLYSAQSQIANGTIALGP